jgi:cytochrome P450
VGEILLYVSLSFFPLLAPSVQQITNFICKSDANDVDHRRLRRVQSHAFSEKALSLQEEYMRKYVHLFISRLGDEVNPPRNGVINAVKWFNYLTTDIIGELAFGESFGGLENDEMHPWLENIFWSLKTFSFFRELSRYPRGIAYAILTLLVPRSRLAHLKNAIIFGAEQAKRRMKRETTRPDFMSYIMRHNDERGSVSKDYGKHKNSF